MIDCCWVRGTVVARHTYYVRTPCAPYSSLVVVLRIFVFCDVYITIHEGGRSVDDGFPPDD